MLIVKPNPLAKYPSWKVMLLHVLVLPECQRYEDNCIFSFVDEAQKIAISIDKTRPDFICNMFLLKASHHFFQYGPDCTINDSHIICPFQSEVTDHMFREDVLCNYIHYNPLTFLMYP